jgi:hypothetical protein
LPCPPLVPLFPPWLPLSPWLPLPLLPWPWLPGEAGVLFGGVLFGGSLCFGGWWAVDGLPGFCGGPCWPFGL